MLLDRKHVHLRAVADQHALDRALSRPRVGDQRVDAGRLPPLSRCRQPGARPRQRLGEPLFVERLEQVVDRVHLERAQRVLVVGGGEDDGHVAPEQLEHLEAVSFGICTSRNSEIRRELGHGLDRLEAVAALGHDLDARDARAGTRESRRAPAARRPR